MMGMQTSQDAFMTVQERIDFSIITLIFGTLVAGLGSYFPCTVLNTYCTVLVPFPSQSQHIRNPDRSDHGEFFLSEFTRSHTVYFSNQ
jgi:hypothetical protein